MIFLSRRRPGTTLVELLLFLAVLSVVLLTVLPLLFLATENRLFQQTASLVEQSGAELLQNISVRIRSAERVLDPPLGSTGSVLTLQTGSGTTNPTIIGVSNGSLVIIRHAQRQTVSSPQIAVDDFSVRNTSASAERPAVLVSFTLSRTVRLQAPHVYSRRFEMLVTLPPADRPTGDDCACAFPGCGTDGQYAWQVCEEGVCLSGSTALDCP
ncbi:MAG: hypothetical protein PHW10_02025 [Candidatus Peribacteraceae bacterium]|nr:hypothetical protein [Candidatus Peribacteraceae bacterium]